MKRVGLRHSIVEEEEGEEGEVSTTTDTEETFTHDLVEGYTSPQLLSRLRHIDSEVDDVSAIISLFMPVC